jgi:hypothetical protein
MMAIIASAPSIGITGAALGLMIVLVALAVDPDADTVLGFYPTIGTRPGPAAARSATVALIVAYAAGLQVVPGYLDSRRDPSTAPLLPLVLSLGSFGVAGLIFATGGLRALNGARQDPLNANPIPIASAAALRRAYLLLGALALGLLGLAIWVLLTGATRH